MGGASSVAGSESPEATSSAPITNSRTFRRLHVKLYNSIGEESSIEAKLRNEFNSADGNHDGFLTKAELKSAAEKCGVSLTDSRLEEVLSSFDTKQDGTVEFEKICRVFQPQKPVGSRTPSPLRYIANPETAPEPPNTKPRRKLSDAQKMDQHINSSPNFTVSCVHELI